NQRRSRRHAMNQTLSEKVRWTTTDLDLLAADEWKRYEIIDGELFVTRAPTSGINLSFSTSVQNSKIGQTRRS
ncbi:hypothetical protein QUV16_23305, partial [Xanthomonas citri pv. citri]